MKVPSIPEDLLDDLQNDITFRFRYEQSPENALRARGLSANAVERLLSLDLYDYFSDRGIQFFQRSCRLGRIE